MNNLPSNLAFNVSSDITATGIHGAVQYQAGGSGQFVAGTMFDLTIDTNFPSYPKYTEQTTSAGTTLKLEGIEGTMTSNTSSYTVGVGANLSDPFGYLNFTPLPGQADCVQFSINGSTVSAWHLRGQVGSAVNVQGARARANALEDLYVAASDVQELSIKQFSPIQIVTRALASSSSTVTVDFRQWGQASISSPISSAQYSGSMQPADLMLNTEAGDLLQPGITRHWSAQSASFGVQITATDTSSSGTTSLHGSGPFAADALSVPADNDPDIQAAVNAFGPAMDQLDTCGQGAVLNIWGWFPAVKWVSFLC
jgi:hypothetical protein